MSEPEPSRAPDSPPDDAVAAAFFEGGEVAAEASPKGSPPESAFRGLEHPPVLGTLTAIAAGLDLGINRVATRALSELDDPTAVFALMTFGALPRNLVGIAGLVAWVFALTRHMRVAPRPITFALAAVSGLFTTVLVTAVAVPRDRSDPQVLKGLVLYALIASQMLVVLLAWLGLRAGRHTSRWLRGAAILALATAAQAGTVVIIASYRDASGGTWIAPLIGPLAYAARHGGEIAWLMVPVLLFGAVLEANTPARVEPSALPGAVPGSTLPSSTVPSSTVPSYRRAARAAVASASWRRSTWVTWVPIAGGAIAAAAVLALGIAGELTLHPYYSVVMYGAVRVAALPERATVLYVVPLALGAAASVSGLLSRDPRQRQIGAGAILWIAGGYAGRTPVQLLETVLGVALIARALLSRPTPAPAGR